MKTIISFPSPSKCEQVREAWIKDENHLTKKNLGNQLQVIESVRFILLTDWQLMKIPYQPFFLGYESKEKKSRRTLFRKPLEKQIEER